MEFNLNEMQKDIRSIAREYAEKFIRPRIEEIENAKEFPEDLYAVMADMGLIGVPYPEEYGGVGAGYLETAIVLEEIGRVSASAATLLTVCYLPLDAFHLYANEEQLQKYMVPCINGSQCGSFAFTEPGTGSDPKQLTTIARKKGDKYYITGTKRFISNASYNGPIVVFAKEEETGECTAFIVDKFCKGYSLSTPWEKVSLRGSNIYDVFFDEVEASEEDVLGKHGQGFDILIGTTAYGKLAFSAVFTGTMQGSYELAVVSPGISERSEFFAHARAHAGEVMGEPEFAWRESPERWVAITGTNGKTTTTALTAELLRAAGLDAEAVGNIGTLITSVLDERRDGEWFVAELSSYQLATTSRLHPKAACLLNVTPDHLSWHGSMEAYALAKEKAFANLTPDDLAVVSCEDAWCRAAIARLEERGLCVCHLSTSDDPATPSAAFVRDVFLAKASYLRAAFRAVDEAGGMRAYLTGPLGLQSALLDRFCAAYTRA